MIDKNKPSTWRVYNSNLCVDCIATCCTMPLEVRIEDLVRLGYVDYADVDELTRKETQKIAKQLIKDGIVKTYRESTGLFLMSPKSNGDCQFLNSERTCNVYDKRPGVCRNFPEKMGLRFGFCPYIKKERNFR